jgi:hypothetical protein
MKLEIKKYLYDIQTSIAFILEVQVDQLLEI